MTGATQTRRNRLSPATMMLTHLILVWKFVMPYALPVGGMASITYAGFLYHPVAGFALLGACMIYFQVVLENTRGD